MKVGVSTEFLRGPPLRIIPSSLAPSLPRTLPVIPCDPTPILAAAILAREVSAPTDRFRCEPYSAVLFARECVRRQDAAGQMGPRKGRGTEATKLHRIGDYFHCKDCAVGGSIRKRLSS